MLSVALLYLPAVHAVHAAGSAGTLSAEKPGLHRQCAALVLATGDSELVPQPLHAWAPGLALYWLAAHPTQAGLSSVASEDGPSVKPALHTQRVWSGAPLSMGGAVCELHSRQVSAPGAGW